MLTVSVSRAPSSSCKSDGLPWGAVICPWAWGRQSWALIGWSNLNVGHELCWASLWPDFILVVRSVTIVHLICWLHPRNEQWSREFTLSNEYRQFPLNWNQKAIYLHLTYLRAFTPPSASGSSNRYWLRWPRLALKLLVDWYPDLRSCPNQSYSSRIRTLTILPTQPYGSWVVSFGTCWTALTVDEPVVRNTERQLSPSFHGAP